MAGKPTSDNELKKALDAFKNNDNNQTKAAAELGIPRETFQSRLANAQRKFANGELKPDFEVATLPSYDPPIDELREFRRKTWERKHAAASARSLINVKVNLDGPIGILHFGDPHVDDDGCNFPQLERDVELVQNTDGLFGGNVGDLQNNWVGRLGALYANQNTTAQQSWKLVEWLVQSVDWLYLVLGNHDMWSGNGDPLQFMKNSVGVMEPHGARLNLVFPNSKQVRINARHDFSGHSMWNPNHGPVKAIKAGWRDHILTCGHLHQTGFGPPLKDPATGLISWPLRCAGYKEHDEYADKLGLPNQNISPSILTVIDPRYDDDDPRLITPFLSSEEGAEFLLWKRKKAGAESTVGRNRGKR